MNVRFIFPEDAVRLATVISLLFLLFGAAIVHIAEDRALVRLAYQEEQAVRLNLVHEARMLEAEVELLNQRVRFLERQYDQIVASSRMSWAQVHRFLRSESFITREAE